MKSVRYNLLILLSVVLFSCSKENAVSQPSTPLSIRGVDASYIPEIRISGVVTRNAAGVAEDMLTTLRNAGVNTIRLRIWKNPLNSHSGFDEVVAFSKEIKAMGMKVWLTVHYSDWWADPGKQTKPAQWQNLSFAQLKDSVYAYTKNIVAEINPDYIQIGNEINNGMLWPDGSFNNISQLTQLLEQGIKAVRDNSSTSKIMIHYAGHQDAVSFFNKFPTLDYDIIGLSYYPNWHGKNLDSLQTNLNLIGNTFNKDVVIAETSYPFTFDWNDNTGNVIGTEQQILPAYPPTAQGQLDFLNKIRDIVTGTKRGIGFCYWGAEWIAFKGKNATDGSSWENQALWDFDNKALPAMQAFK